MVLTVQLDLANKLHAPVVCLVLEILTISISILDVGHVEEVFTLKLVDHQAQDPKDNV
jgi:hypothetical protein